MADEPHDGEVSAAAPLLGQHTDEVLTQVLGYSAAEVDAAAGGGRAGLETTTYARVHARESFRRSHEAIQSIT